MTSYSVSKIGNLGILEIVVDLILERKDLGLPDFEGIKNMNCEPCLQYKSFDNFTSSTSWKYSVVRSMLKNEKVYEHCGTS